MSATLPTRVEGAARADRARSAVHRADAALRHACARAGVVEGSAPDHLGWADYRALVAAMKAALGPVPTPGGFIYEHPPHLQDPRAGVGKPYPVPLAYFDSGGDGEPVIAIGGITNVARRFDFFALDSAPALRVISLDLAGRGRSGWLAELSDYHLETYVEQLRQLLAHLGLESCTLLGSSLGSSTVIRFAARHPRRVRRIILNDSGPWIPAARRTRRARAVARHYVFHSPSEMFRRTGAAAKHAGPAPDAALLYSAHHKTRWSKHEQGRVYRHDLRALLAYRVEAGDDLDLWDEWAGVECPVLLVHGALSDATSDETIAGMRGHRGLSVIHVPEVGHTPTLSDRTLIEDIARWVRDDRRFADRVRPTTPWRERILYP